jgi:hypothetical protein
VRVLDEERGMGGCNDVVDVAVFDMDRLGRWNDCELPLGLAWAVEDVGGEMIGAEPSRLKLAGWGIFLAPGAICAVGKTGVEAV